MKTTLITAAAFILPMLFAASLAWLGGFNFDHRNFDVAYGFGFATVMSGAIASFVYSLTTGKF